MVNITQHLKSKEYWRRRINDESAAPKPPKASDTYYEMPDDDFAAARFQFLTQDDFLNEIEPTAHAVNSIYQSTRPVNELQEFDEVQEDGSTKKVARWVTVGYDPVEVVAMGIQQCLSIKKATHFASKGFWISNETKYDDLFSVLTSWADTANLSTAYMEAVTSCFQTGDAAIYFYTQGNNIYYKVFSYLYGDVLFPDLDENRRPILYRKYLLKGKLAVDVYGCGFVETWVRFNEDSETDASWLEKVKGWFNRNVGKTVSEDGFTLISRTESQVSNDICQAVYFRVRDIPTGVAQQNIEKLEDAVSYNAEEVKNTSMPTLFIKAKKIENLPAVGTNGRTIGVRGNSEDLKAADAKYLEGADHSNTYTSHVDMLWKTIVRTTMSVFVEPTDMKNGADSSASFRLMFAPEEQWCKNMWPQFAPHVKELTEVFKQLVAKVEGKTSEYAKLRLSVGLDFWLPENEQETINNVVSQVNARVLSRKAAMSELSNSHLDDYEEVQKEWEDEIRIKAEIPAEVQSKYDTTTTTDDKDDDKSGDGDNNNSNPVDKRNRGRSIQDR
jgi:hypothetical protein